MNVEHVRRRILVCGSRTYTNRMRIHCVLMDQWQDIGGFEIIHGDAKGADQIVKKFAMENRIPQHTFPAKWDKHGRKVNMSEKNGIFSTQSICNILMLDMKPVLVLAFYDKVASKGTKYIVTEAKKRGIKVKIWMELA